VVPLVVPEEPNEMVIQGSLDTAVHRHPGGVPAEMVIGVEAGPPLPVAVALVGEISTLVQAGCCA
jgi:hypothetical protein